MVVAFQKHKQVSHSTALQLPSVVVAKPGKRDQKASLSEKAEPGKAAHEAPLSGKAAVFALYGLQCSEEAAPSGGDSPMSVDIASTIDLLSPPSPAPPLAADVATKTPPLTADVAASSGAPQSPGVQAQYVDHCALTMVRLLASGGKQQVPLEEGPEGFAVASFDGVLVQSEVPNALIMAAKEQPRKQQAKRLCKRPAAQHPPGAAQPPPEGVAAEPASGQPRYHLMWYKAAHWCAVRIRQGRQVLSFGGKKVEHLTRECLEDFGYQAIEKLLAGGEPHAVKAWCQGQVEREGM